MQTTVTVVIAEKHILLFLLHNDVTLDQLHVPMHQAPIITCMVPLSLTDFGRSVKACSKSSHIEGHLYVLVPALLIHGIKVQAVTNLDKAAH